jgi:signal transduction histidine kinase
VPQVIGRIAAGALHELNNALGVIANATELLRRNVQTGDAGAEELAVIAEATRHATTLCRHLTTLSRVEPVAPVALDVNAVIVRIAELLRTVLGTDIVIVTDLAPSLDAVLADPGALERDLVSLAADARDAMPNGGTLTIRTTAGPDCVIVDVGPSQRRLGYPD